MYTIQVLLRDNQMLKLLMLVICADMLLGILRAVKYRQFNSSAGINGAIRKVAMLVCMVLLVAADALVNVNLLSVVPEDVLAILAVKKVGLSELFGLLFGACECLSILKNMLLCGLPVPKYLQNGLEGFLQNMTAEMPMEKSTERPTEIPTNGGGVRHG